MRRVVLATVPRFGFVITRSPEDEGEGFKIALRRKRLSGPLIEVALYPSHALSEIPHVRLHLAQTLSSPDSDATDTMRVFLLGVLGIEPPDQIDDENDLGLPWVADLDPTPHEEAFAEAVEAGDYVEARDAVSDLFDRALSGSNMREGMWDEPSTMERNEPVLDEGEIVWNLEHANAFENSPRTVQSRLTWSVADPVFRVLRGPIFRAVTRERRPIEIGSGVTVTEALADAGLVVFDRGLPGDWRAHAARAVAEGPAIETAHDLEMYRLLGRPVPYRLPDDRFYDFISRAGGDR